MKIKYREVYCPVCMKNFMTSVYSDLYTAVVKYNGIKMKGWEDRCPKCNTSLFVEDHVLEGIKMDDFPEGAVKRKLILD